MRSRRPFKGAMAICATIREKYKKSLVRKHVLKMTADQSSIFSFQIVIEQPQVLPNPSPRGNPSVEIDEGTELKTFNVSSFNQHARKAHDEQYDEAVSVTSDDNDDIQNVHVHERLYGPQTQSSGFASMDAEDDEEYEEEFSIKHAQAHKALGERTTFGGRDGRVGRIELPVKDRDFYHTGSPGQNGRPVDASVTFPLRCISSSSTPVRRYGSVSTSEEPPFGNQRSNQLDQVGRSVEKLLDSTKSSPPPASMPVGEPIRSLEEGMGGVMSSEEKDKTEQTGSGRKKKKKKKTKGKHVPA